MVTQEFVRMALSEHGCDGGNFSSTIWTFGLEWGGGYSEEELEKQLKKTTIERWSWGTREYTQVEDVLRAKGMGYNQKLAWFFAYILSWDVNNYVSEAVKYRLFCDDGTGYKGNAFPISFKNRDTINWGKRFQELTGLNSFNDYKAWCIEHRGTYFCELIKVFSPKLIVCTGKQSKDEFMQFFRCKNAIEHSEHLHLGSTNNNKTVVAVVPFFGGPSGINSYEKMKYLTSDVNGYCIDYFRDQSWAI